MLRAQSRRREQRARPRISPSSTTTRSRTRAGSRRCFEAQRRTGAAIVCGAARSVLPDGTPAHVAAHLQRAERTLGEIDLDRLVMTGGAGNLMVTAEVFRAFGPGTFPRGGAAGRRLGSRVHAARAHARLSAPTGAPGRHHPPHHPGRAHPAAAHPGARLHPAARSTCAAWRPIAAGLSGSRCCCSARR